MFKIGKVVRSKDDKSLYGTIHYSSFGFSIHFWTMYDGKLVLSKTLGRSESELSNHWEIARLPKGYEIHKYGGVVKIG